MMTLSTRAAMVFIGLMTLSSMLGMELALAESKKPKATPHAKTMKPKTKPRTTSPPKTIKKPTAEPTFHTAETAADTTACFGIAPQIEKLVPDEGEPGAQVTITGVEFGSPDCLRGVSFGPGHASIFTMNDESTIVTTVPAGVRKGLVMVTVTTASGEDSKAFLVK